MAGAARLHDGAARGATAGRCDVFQVPMRDFFGGLAVMVGIGFLGWGALFLIRYPHHGEGEMAVILGFSALLIGLFLIFLSSHDAE